MALPFKELTLEKVGKFSGLYGILLEDGIAQSLW
jgi:hypothetical protein